MTLCSICNYDYIAHSFGELVKCNRQKDFLIFNYKLEILSNTKDDKKNMKTGPYN